jgi:hypothetical protein
MKNSPSLEEPSSLKFELRKQLHKKSTVENLHKQEEEERSYVVGGINGVIKEYTEIAARFDSHP